MTNKKILWRCPKSLNKEWRRESEDVYSSLNNWIPILYNLQFNKLKLSNQGGVFSDIPPIFYLFGQFNPLMANVLRYIFLIFAHRKRDLRHCYQKLWTAPTYQASNYYLHIASRMVYWMRWPKNNSHQSSASLRVCCQREKMQIVSICYREEKTHNREIAFQLVSVCYQEKTQLGSVCYREKTQMRTNQSLLDMTPRNDRFKWPYES